ncbi:ribonuclease H-like domain-containing protein [Tanacetum coccineum]
MVTCFRVGSNCSTERLNLHISNIYHLPKSNNDAITHPNWQNAICDEYNALIRNKTSTLVHRPTDTNIVRCMWLFRHKYLTYSTLSHYKARLVVNGSIQLKGIDVDETFSLVWLLLGSGQFISLMSRMPSYMKKRADTAYLLLYVDDIVLTASSKALLPQIIA